jgi:predicted esterase
MRSAAFANSRRSRWLRRALALVVALGSIAPVTHAQSGEAALADTSTLADLEPGSIAGRLTSKLDPRFHYAAYLPPGYRRTAPAPLLIVMDPRGRAMVPLKLVREIAARVGWIVLSSYETAGDDSTAPNAGAVNAMLNDAQSMLNVDARRIYFAGFSGLARATWQFADVASGGVAGIISAGASGPQDAVWRIAHKAAPTYDVVLVAGDEDYNLEAVRFEYSRLAELGVPVRFETFAGGHEWPTDSAMNNAIAWLEARSALRPRARRPLIGTDSLYGADTLRARRLENQQRIGEAADAWTRTAVAWNGLTDISAAIARARTLANDTAVVRWRAKRSGLDEVYAEWNEAMIATFDELKSAWRPDAKWLRRELELDSLTRWAATPTDSVRAAWAARRISLIYTQLVTYQVDILLTSKRSRGALAALAVARQLNPGANRMLCAREADAYDQMRDTARASAARACAAGTPPPSTPSTPSTPSRNNSAAKFSER